MIYELVNLKNYHAYVEANNEIEAKKMGQKIFNKMAEHIHHEDSSVYLEDLCLTKNFDLEIYDGIPKSQDYYSRKRQVLLAEAYFKSIGW